MESHGNPQVTQAVTKATGDSPQTDRTRNEYGEIELVPTQSLHPYMLTSLVQEVTLHTTKRKM